jgi:tetratricopeptide (TPR) repeat protein
MKLILLSTFLIQIVFVSTVLPQTEIPSKGEILINKADSLLKDYPTESIRLAKAAFDNSGNNDKIFVNSSSILAEAYRNIGNYDSVEHYTNIGLQKALKIKDTVQIILFYLNLGSDYYYKADYSKAMEAYKNSSKYYSALGIETNNDEISPLDYAKLLNNMGTAYIKTGHYDSSLICFIRSVKVKEAQNAPASMMIVGKINIGSIYLAIRDYKNSEIWLNQALSDAEQEKDSGYMARCYANLGVLHKRLGDTLKAIDNYKDGLKINESLGDHRNTAIICQNMALLYSSLKKYDEAYDCYSKALVNNNKIHANNSRLHLAIGRIFLEQEMYDSSISHGNLALKLANKSGNTDVQLEDYELLYKAYEGKRKFPEAYVNIKKYLFLKDSVNTKENQEYIQNLKTEFETERKENEILLLKELNQSEHLKSAAIQSRQQIIIIAVLLALSLVVVAAFYYFTKKKKERELYLVEKKLLETELENKELASKKMRSEINFKTKQLTTHALNMLQRNQMLIDIHGRLNNLAQKTDDRFSMEFKSIIKDLSKNKKTEKDWDLFRNYFENVNKGFNGKLREINPKLSTHDYRLAALISLNLNIKETSELLHISPNSVKIARHRLRKRLNVKNGEDLYVFLSKL